MSRQAIKIAECIDNLHENVIIDLVLLFSEVNLYAGRCFHCMPIS